MVTIFQALEMQINLICGRPKKGAMTTQFHKWPPERIDLTHGSRTSARLLHTLNHLLVSSFPAYPMLSKMHFTMITSHCPQDKGQTSQQDRGTWE